VNASEEKLSGAIQENILILLCFSDDYCQTIRHAVTPNLFGSAVYREVAEHAIDFIDQYGSAIKDHISDSLENILNGSDKRKATSYQRLLENLYGAKDTVNGDYVVSQLHRFVRQQSLKSAVVAAVEAIESGHIEKAEVELQKGLANQAVSFELGTQFQDPGQVLKFLDSTEQGIHTGIAELDRRDICPRPGEMFMFIAPAKKGKSWALISLGKWAILQRKRVLHISLEMSEQRVAQRYLQAFFSVSKRDPKVKVPLFTKDERGVLLDIHHQETQHLTLNDQGIRSTLTKKIKKEFSRRPPLIIKQFPTGALTISALRAYLDGLERFHKIIPDVIILDYPDLMDIDGNQLRVDTGKIYKDLRGIAVSKNLAVVVASQGNRTSASAKMVTDSMVAEDYSKIATADNVLTYSQTPQEHKLGLARLFVSNGRNDEDKFVVLISQSYTTGQFCLDSALMSSAYEAKLNGQPEEGK
jgi:replicative DNA helicase